MALTRHVSCKAHCKTTCLALSKEDFIENVFFVEQITKINRLNYIKTLPLTKGWPVDKINKLNSCMNSMRTIAGEKIYSKGAYPEVFYFVQSGTVSIDSLVRLEETHQFPVAHNQWQLDIIATEV
jgi:hypothetical protein